MQQMGFLLDVARVLLPPRMESGDRLADRRRREEDRITDRSRPLVEEIESNQRAYILRPSVDTLDIARRASHRGYGRLVKWDLPANGTSLSRSSSRT